MPPHFILLALICLMIFEEEYNFMKLLSVQLPPFSHYSNEPIGSIKGREFIHWLNK
jgi:hypothetical protein